MAPADARPPRLYRVLLRLLPRSLREEFGDDMARLFDDRCREADGSRLARSIVWLRAVGDLVRHALAERFQPPRPIPHAPRTGSSLMERWLSDLRYALRGLRQAPDFSVSAIVMLALGIGATVAIFSAVDGVLLRPLPYPEPERLVRVWPQYNFNKAMIQRVDDAVPAIEDVVGISGWLFTLTGEGDPQQISGALVSWNYFELLGVQPALGRGFIADEGLVGQADVVVLSHGVWVNLFGADPDIVGRRLELAAGDYPTRRVVGVMPPDFRDPDPGFRIWSPLDLEPGLAISDDNSWYVNQLIGRLQGDATVELGTEQIQALVARLHEEWPERFDEEEQSGATVEELQAYQVRNLRAVLWTLLGAVGLVLLIGCVNVANLMLARGTTRRHGLAVRAALGASRGRIAAQLLCESLLLGVAGCVGGLVLGAATLRLLVAVAPEELHQLADASINLPVLGFAIVLSLAAVVAVGMVPAWRASAVEPGDSVGATSRGTTGSGGLLTHGLVAVEVAVAVVLVLGSGLMLRSLYNIYNDDLGMDGSGVLTFRISIPEGRFDDEALPPHYRRVWEAIEAVPGVEEVGGIHLLPLRRSNWNFPYATEDHPRVEGSPPPTANHRIVTPTYFETLRIPIVRGRGFTDADTAGAASVGMINETMAGDLWPGEDPIGKRMTVFGSTFTIVGVAGDHRQHGVHFDIQPEMYRPFDQWPTPGMFALVRTTGRPTDLVPSLERAIWDVDADAPIARIQTMDEVFGESVARDRFISLLLAAFGALAATLGALGVYGVTAYAIGRRRREFGVRMAIGADRSRVLRQALGDGLKPVVIGLALGIVGAWWSADVLAGLLYDISAYDLPTFALVPMLMFVVALIACALPARRASRLDPVMVLRDD